MVDQHWWSPIEVTQHVHLVHVPIAREANVYPMVPPGAANRQMIAEPELASAHA